MESKAHKKSSGEILQLSVVLMTPIVMGLALYSYVRIGNHRHFSGVNVEFEGIVLEIKELGRYDIVHLAKISSRPDCFERDVNSDAFFCLIDDACIDVLCSSDRIRFGDTLSCMINEKYSFLLYRGRGERHLINPYVPLVPVIGKQQSFIHPVNCE